MVETLVKVKPGEKVLIVAEDKAIPMAKAVMDVANSVASEVAVGIIKAKEMPGYEPPSSVAVGMKSVNTVILIFTGSMIEHTDARKEATAAGVRTYLIAPPFERFTQEITSVDLMQIKERTERVTEKLSKAQHARVTTPSGTNILMSLKGRQALGIHPLWGEGMAVLPDYAEAAIAPVEGTAQGTLVIDIWVGGWGYTLKEPIRCVVKSGRVVEISGDEDV